MIEIWGQLYQEGKLPDMNKLLLCHLNKDIDLGKLGDPAIELTEYIKGIALCEELSEDKCSSVTPTHIKLYKYRAITYRDGLHEPEKEEADFEKARQLECD